MVSIVRSVLRAGTSAARMRCKLRAVTRPVHRASAAAAGIGRVSGALPTRVLGADLIRLMSGPLQRALRSTPVDSNDARAPRRTVDFSSLGALDAQKPAQAGVLAPRSSASRRSAGGSSQVADRIAAEPEHLGDRAVGTLGGERYSWLGASNWSEGGSTALQGARSAATSDALDRAHPSPAPLANALDERRNPFEDASVPALTAKVREYWQLTREENLRCAQRVDASARPEPTRVGSSTIELDLAAARQRDDAHQAQNIEQSLQRFVSGGSPAEAGAFRARSRVWPLTSLARASDPNRRGDFHEERAGAPMTAEPSWDLSERIADILREQALQHGIDLT